MFQFIKILQKYNKNIIIEIDKTLINITNHSLENINSYIKSIKQQEHTNNILEESNMDIKNIDSIYIEDIRRYLIFKKNIYTKELDFKEIINLNKNNFLEKYITFLYKNIQNLSFFVVQDNILGLENYKEILNKYTFFTLDTFNTKNVKIIDNCIIFFDYNLIINRQSYIIPKIIFYFYNVINIKYLDQVIYENFLFSNLKKKNIKFLYDYY